MLSVYLPAIMLFIAMNTHQSGQPTVVNTKNTNIPVIKNHDEGVA